MGEIMIFFLNLIRTYFYLLFFSVCYLFNISFSCFNVSVLNYYYYFNTNIILEPVDFNKIVSYNYDLKFNDLNILQEGVVGYSVLGSEKVIIDPVDEVVEVGKGPLSVFNGSTTGYGSNCYGCSGTVACLTKEGDSHNLIMDGIYYKDSTFGDLRIVASDHSKFSCGTVIEIDNGNIEPFMAIVLDTGVAMRNAWRNEGKILLDIAFKYEDSDGIYNATNKNNDVILKVYRNGW